MSRYLLLLLFVATALTAGWGFGVAVAVYVAGRMSAGHINPAVTLGLAAAQALSEICLELAAAQPGVDRGSASAGSTT